MMKGRSRLSRLERRRSIRNKSTERAQSNRPRFSLLSFLSPSTFSPSLILLRLRPLSPHLRYSILLGLSNPLSLDFFSRLFPPLLLPSLSPTPLPSQTLIFLPFPFDAVSHPLSFSVLFLPLSLARPVFSLPCFYSTSLSWALSSYCR